MKTKFKKIYFFGAILTALTISSCKKNESPTPMEPSVSTSIQNNLASPVKEDDYLVFKDLDNLKAFQNEYVNKKQDELDKWEQSLNFTSYRKLFSQAANEMENLATQEQYDSFKSKYSSLVAFSADGTIEYKYIPNYAPFINKDGIVKVGNILYKLMEDRMIFITDGDKSKINAALDYRDSKPDQGVLVSYIEKISTNDKNKVSAVTTNSYFEINEQIGYNNLIAGDKLEVWLHFFRIYNPITTGNGCGWSESVYLNLTEKSSTRATFGGGWKEKKCSISAQGGFSIDVVVPPLSESCTGVPYSGGALRKLNTPFNFPFEYTSYRIWQVYGGAQIWNYVNPSQNVVLSFWSNSYSACIGANVPLNK